MLLVNRPVAANCELVKIERLRGRECGGPCPYIRIGNVFVEKERLRREPVGGNPVSGKSRARAVRRRQWVIDGVQSSRAKVALFHSRGRHDIVEDQSLSLAHPFIIYEEKRLLLAAQKIRQVNRAAQGAAKLITFQYLASGSEEVACV